ncbi:MAG TPA: DUF433 domain-containing protein [Bacteroidota bacterium]|nr:DUF433 domain-containing protein [Bacteroidota bacterium]
MNTATAYKYIEKRSETGEPILQNTRISVRDIVENWKLGSSPEEIATIFPHITLAQVFEALAYYQDNRQGIESFIEKNHIPEDLRGSSLSR